MSPPVGNRPIGGGALGGPGALGAPTDTGSPGPFVVAAGATNLIQSRLVVPMLLHGLRR